MISSHINQSNKAGQQGILTAVYEQEHTAEELKIT
jgi:hypothetical protein